MNVSRETLLREAAATGFRPEVLEKVLHLIGLLDAVNRHPFLGSRLALKGGTALNLFLFDLPRLSVDIDLNYVGAAGREAMLAERPTVIEGITAICRREGLTVRTTLDGHAGVSWHLRYGSALGQQGNLKTTGNLKIDLNFMFRVPLWPVERQSSRPVGSFRAEDIPLMDRHELAAGKLAALLSRHTSRDLFDAYELLVRGIPGRPLDPERLRLAFVVYGAINREDWRTVSPADVDPATKDMDSFLLPLLREGALAETGPSGTWGQRIAAACQEALGAVLPLTESERAFLDRLLDEGEIEPALLTEDAELAERLRRHPGLAWKALNVRGFKKQGFKKPGTSPPAGGAKDIETL